jgi:hypothetical protein
MFNTKKMPKNQQIVFDNVLNVMSKYKPLLASVVWLNENFENIYSTCQTDIEVYEYIFNYFKIKYKKDKNEI